MDINKKVRKVIESDREGDVILESEAVANLQTANILKIADVEFTKVIILAVVLSAKKEYFDAQRHVPGAALRLEILLKQLANMYFVNGEYYEKQAILLNDPSMILDLGYKYYKPRKAISKLPLEMRNTDIDGELFALPDFVEGTRYYNLECTISGTETVLRTDIIKNSKGENVAGFTSMDLLMFRSQAVDMAGNKKPWTPYFTIRVR